MKESIISKINFKDSFNTYDNNSNVTSHLLRKRNHKFEIESLNSITKEKNAINKISENLEKIILGAKKASKSKKKNDYEDSLDNLSFRSLSLNSNHSSSSKNTQNSSFSLKNKKSFNKNKKIIDNRSENKENSNNSYSNSNNDSHINRLFFIESPIINDSFILPINLLNYKNNENNCFYYLFNDNLIPDKSNSVFDYFWFKCLEEYTLYRIFKEFFIGFYFQTNNFNTRINKNFQKNKFLCNVIDIPSNILSLKNQNSKELFFKPFKIGHGMNNKFEDIDIDIDINGSDKNKLYDSFTLSSQLSDDNIENKSIITNLDIKKDNRTLNLLKNKLKHSCLIYDSLDKDSNLICFDTFYSNIKKMNCFSQKNIDEDTLNIDLKES